MINGDVKEFINGLYYGDERFFTYNKSKYFIQGYSQNQKPMLVLYVLEPADNNFKWQAVSENSDYPVSEFEEAKIFNGKTFWEAEQEIEWLDC
ncbi:MAG: hypothetical protein NC120_02840 [Ruminococcus sp.]|nr:hypothetical protein [Ruminococcus sp.]